MGDQNRADRRAPSEARDQLLDSMEGLIRSPWAWRLQLCFGGARRRESDYSSPPHPTGHTFTSERKTYLLGLGVCRDRASVPNEAQRAALCRALV